jgi:hypothetical protein
MARRIGVAPDEFKMASNSSLNVNANFQRRRYGCFEGVIAVPAFAGVGARLTSLFYPDVQNRALKHPPTSRAFPST